MPKIRKIPEGYITVKQAADKMDLSVVWMYELLKTNKIPTHKFGVTLIKETDFEKIQPKPGGFQLGAMKHNPDINIIIFKDKPKIDKVPLKNYSGDQTIDVGQNIVGLIDKRTSAGFGRFHLAESFVRYLGKATAGKHRLILFEINGADDPERHFFGYIELSAGELFFLNWAGSGRLLRIDLVLYNHITPNELKLKLRGDQ